MANSGIDHHVYIKQCELIFWAYLVKVEKVYETCYLSILFFHRNYIYEPGRVLDGVYKTYIQKLIDFLFDLHPKL